MATPNAASALPATLRKRSQVLVVDDEPDTLESLKSLIDRLMPGAQAIPASSPQRALEILADDGADVVISDYRLPGMNGVAFLREARRIAPNAPRMLITAYPDLKVVMQVVQDGGIRNIMTKPIDVEAFLQAVAALISSRRRAWPLPHAKAPVRGGGPAKAP